MGDVGLHVFRRDAPCVGRKQNGLLAALRNRCPKLAVENFAVGLDQHSGVGHLVFVRAENLAEILDFRVHAVEHLPDGIDFDLAAFKTLERKANRQMFGQLHQD